MSNNESPEWAKRDAKLYLHLAEAFGWTPEQIAAIDPAVRFAMAKDLGLSPAENSVVAVTLEVDGKAIYRGVMAEAQRHRRNNGHSDLT